MLLIYFRSVGGTAMLELLADPDDLFPPAKWCPELTKNLDISICVDCHTALIIVFKPEWSNDAILGNGNPGSEF